MGNGDRRSSRGHRSQVTGIVQHRTANSRQARWIGKMDSRRCGFTEALLTGNLRQENGFGGASPSQRRRGEGEAPPNPFVREAKEPESTEGTSGSPHRSSSVGCGSVGGADRRVSHGIQEASTASGSIRQFDWMAVMQISQSAELQQQEEQASWTAFSTASRVSPVRF